MLNFVVQVYFIANDFNSKFKAQSPKIQGAREFRKLISKLHFGDEMDLQRAPAFYNSIFINMQVRENCVGVKDSNSDCSRILMPVYEVQEIHHAAKKAAVERFENESRTGIIEAFLSERDAKNEAYYFIINSGNFELFAEYCQLRREGVLS